jgi:hypothetical protein
MQTPELRIIKSFTEKLVVKVDKEPMPTGTLNKWQKAKIVTVRQEQIRVLNMVLRQITRVENQE